MDIEIHNIHTIEQLKEKFEVLGNSAQSDFAKMQSFIDEKMSKINGYYHTLITRVQEAEQRLENAQTELLIAKASFDIDKNGNRVPKNTSSERAKVRRCEDGLMVATKNLRAFEEPYEEMKRFLQEYNNQIDNMQYNLCIYPQKMSQSLVEVIARFKEYINFSNQNINQ